MRTAYCGSRLSTALYQQRWVCQHTRSPNNVFQKCLTTAKCCNMQLFFGGVLLYGGFTVGLRWCVCLVIDDAALATPQPRHQRKKNWGWPNGDNGLLNIFARFSRIGRNCGLALSLSSGVLAVGQEVRDEDLSHRLDAAGCRGGQGGGRGVTNAAECDQMDRSPRSDARRERVQMA